MKPGLNTHLDSGVSKNKQKSLFIYLQVALNTNPVQNQGQTICENKTKSLQ